MGSICVQDGGQQPHIYLAHFRTSSFESVVFIIISYPFRMGDDGNFRQPVDTDAVVGDRIIQVIS
jgi:hypothetical protein